MRFQRWCIATIDEDGWPKELRDRCQGWSHRHTFEGNKALFKVEFEQDELSESQNIPGVVVLPSLNAPASRLPQGVLDWLAAHGIVPDAGDTVLNVLRTLRDKFGEKFTVDLSV